jgi:hypothetical protein
MTNLIAKHFLIISRTFALANVIRAKRPVLGKQRAMWWPKATRSILDPVAHAVHSGGQVS